MRVIVLRGIPGSGKSRVAHSVPDAAVVSADDYFVCGDTYRFDPAMLGEAHNDCLRRYLSLFRHHADQIDTIVVDNTNASIAEMAPYMAIAAAHGVDAEIVEVLCDVETAAARNLHGVPPEVVQRIHDTMKANDPLIPPWWKRVIR